MAKTGISKTALEEFIGSIENRRDAIEDQYDILNNAATTFIGASEGEMIEAFQKAQNIMSAQHYQLYEDGFSSSADYFVNLEESLVAIDKNQAEEGATLSV